MNDEAIGSLDASEQAYFDNGGEEAQTPATEQAESAQQTVVEETTQEAGQEVEQPKQTKTVPLAALHEERAKAKEMRQKLQQLEEQTRIGNERLQQLAMAMQQRAMQQQPPIPDFEQDPATNLHARLQQTEARQQELAQYAAMQRQEAERQAAIQDLTRHVTRQEAEYAAQNPDYHQALEHLKTAEINALVALGHDQHTAAQIITQNVGSMAWQLRQQGESIPEKVYALAKARGYNPQQVTSQQKMQNVQRGVSAAKSLGNGGKVSTNLSLEALASLPSDEFATLVSDDKAWRKLMGG